MRTGNGEDLSRWRDLNDKPLPRRLND